ncbi:MAG: hypothetical protein MI975_14270, partial [Cytophagales bacterium]|nr:hypothetical protein [Cytophagales bacterium]
EKDIFLNGIYYGSNTADFSFNKAKTKLSVENLNIMDFDFFDFTQNRILEISDILIDNADLHHIPALNKTNTSLNLSDSAMYRKLTGSHPAYERSGLHDEEYRENAPDSILLANIKRTLSAQFRKPNRKVGNNRAGLNFHKEEYLFDTMFLKKIKIDRLLISDSKMTFEHSDEDKTGVVAPDIWFLAEGLKYDPIAAKDSSRIFYTDNLKATISNFRYVLPDNLSSVRIDELTLNSKDASVKANNFAIIPLINRYDYGPAKGFQATWIKMENDSVTLSNVDFLGILNERTFNAGNLNVHQPDISIFRDKRVPFPEWQRMSLPQASLRELNFDFGIDTIKLHNGFISYHEHAEKAYTTGEVFFSDLNATIINATNDSTRTLTYPNTRIGATAKIFDAGAVKAEFVFDLVDQENVHSYGVDVEPFDLTEFNRILIPVASVQISSGDSKKIIMTAKANEDYSYGEMKFYYEDLKIKLLNRETETPKGIGNALGSFFANTFIIKSNNPRNLFLRKGDIFFERDKKRAIFNYWTKTFLSGVVSSIGAANNKKKIKKMQEENLKKIQDEKNKLATLY